MTGKIIAKMTIETINEHGLWGEIFDRLTVLFTDGSEARGERWVRGSGRYQRSARSPPYHFQW